MALDRTIVSQGLLSAVLKKIIKIRNVGRLRKVDAAGDVEFRTITLIFAENGRGKTTLCDILRSLKAGSPDYIVGRSTLADSDAQEIQLLFDEGIVNFRDRSWSHLHPEIEIFDSTFVHENVYAGEYVDHEHKRNLYRVVVGEEGVRLARGVDELDAQMREVDRRLADTRAKVERLLAPGISFDEFLGMKSDHQLDSRIRQSEADVAAFTRSSEIRTTAELGLVDLSELPPEFPEVVTRRLEGVAEGAERLVRTHLHEKTAGGSQRWASEGFGYVRTDLCPFCAQRITGLELITAYKAYFGPSYQTLREEVEQLRRRVETLAGETPGLRLEQTVANNEALFRFWSQFLNIDSPTIALEQVRGALRSLATDALSIIARKATALLEHVDLGTGFSEALSRFQLAKQEVARYNEAVAAVNSLVRARKAETETGDLVNAKAVLARLYAAKTRHEGDARVACEEFEASAREKKQLQDTKTAAKQRLDEYSEGILQRFENRINQLLEQFGASFRIGGVSRQYLGGRPSSTYKVVINGVGVDLGDSRTGVGVPSFRNTLSAGDRSALALAFFIARTELDPEIASKILVLDDPFGSQDRSRRKCTQQQICRLSKKCEQTIVLSHEPRFLRSIWDAADRSGIRALQLTRVGEDNSTVTPWNIEDETSDDYFQSLQILRAFADDGRGDPRHVVQTIRPVLEGYLRFNFPGAFSQGEWLGDFLQKIEQSVKGDPLYALKDVLADLEDINDYSKKYHHTEDLVAATEPLDTGELASFVKRTLRLVSAY